MIRTVNPASGEILAEYPILDENEIETALVAALESHREWSRSPMSQRAELLLNLAAVLEQDRTDLAALMAAEMGKPLSQGEAEIVKCARVCRYYAENGPAFLADEEIKTERLKSSVVFSSLGTVLAVMPWNFPFWQLFRFAAPALMAGNPVLLKHALNTFGCGRAAEEIFIRAGARPGLLCNLALEGRSVGRLIADSRIAAVTFTGSTPVGREIGALAGRALKKSVLELGGSDPFVVLADADLTAAAEACILGRFLNSGQSCIAAKRIIVEKTVLDDFLDLFLDGVRRLVCGDPLKREVFIGPLARRDLRDELDDQVQRSLAAGASCLAGGRPGPGPGFFYEPTVLTGVSREAAAFREETFGPLAAVVSAADEREAIELANDTEFGLGAALFTADREKGEFLARHLLQAGICHVNSFVQSDPRLPFGGVKNSGYGRELGSFGIREFVNVKTMVVD